ncbi:twin-arginine translocase TatA/TatE family subunit [Patulibacter sp.]|uniref:twin-arginine translocase TatA/TatE family subunit n=1 Tax=Patulibacter sp. TaxID=1912859 RepID=UPI00351EB0F6
MILVIALLVLGPKKLPEVGKSLGKGMREFKDSLASANPFDDDDDDRPAPRKTPAQQVAAAPIGTEDDDVPTAKASDEDSREAQDAFGANKS